MSLIGRLLHPHYLANAALALSYPIHQIINHPDLLSTASIGAYSRYLLPAMALITIKVRGAQSPEELVSVLSLYMKVFSLYGYWAVSNEPLEFWGSGWNGHWRFVLYLFAWTGNYFLCAIIPLAFDCVDLSCGAVESDLRSSLITFFFSCIHCASSTTISRPIQGYLAGFGSIELSDNTKREEIKGQGACGRPFKPEEQKFKREDR